MTTKISQNQILPQIDRTLEIISAVGITVIILRGYIINGHICFIIVLSIRPCGPLDCAHDNSKITILFLFPHDT